VDAVTPELPGHLPTPSYPCPVHHTLPGNGVLILENLVLSEVAGTRFSFVRGSV
jgi:kynurenine formamidase